ncbi:MAG TPA: site-specific DNA-methyltransferase [Geobacter sp.]|nr:MAG: DNA methyltransferase [Geobacteraceae bacterium GWF2_54_21]HCE67894.1 site-specific DNA-methyltransferase [Geobacter sp.]
MKMNGQSANIVADNIDQLKTLFPEAFTEGKVDFDVLKQLLGGAVDEREEKYGLNWHGKKAARQIALTLSTGTLRPCPDESVDWDTTQNLMIEGDNLEVLKLLQKSYAGKIKLIYFDPPYNTGKDFVYPDNFQDNIKNYLELTGQVEGGKKISSNSEASGRFHTDWLNMMYPRLKLARNLLRDDGLIVVNIDDGESANLKTLMDDVFGEENFLAMISWEKRYTRSNNARLFYSLKDTLVTFRKSDAVATLREARGEKSKEIYSNPDNDPRGIWTSSSYVNPATKDQRPNLSYTITNPSTGERIDHPTHAWKYEYAEHERHLREQRLWWGQSGDAKFPRLKNFLAEMDDGMVPIDLWDYKSTGTTDEGGQELKELFGQAVFDNPKPTKLIQRILGLSCPAIEEDREVPIVLDFFAGSGTTGHAVVVQNVADGGNRRYILVQLPEPLDPENKDQKTAVDFCDKLGKARSIAEITKERLRRAATKIKGENPLFAGDLGFRVFKLDSSNIRTWDPDRDNLEQTLLDNLEHIKPGRSESDILYELLLKLGLDLCVPIETRTVAGKSVQAIGSGVLLTCLAESITREEVESLALGIIAWHKELTPAGDTTCVFRDSAFADDVAKSNLSAILFQHGIENVRSL